MVCRHKGESEEEYKRRQKLYNKQYRKNNEKECKNRDKNYRLNNPEKIRKRNNTYAKNNPEKVREWARRCQLKTKIEVINHYSNGSMMCANPFGEHKEPYTTIEALTIDHINGGGDMERKELYKVKHGGGGTHFYVWLRKNNYPEGYQVLCMNCQFIKRVRNDEMLRAPKLLNRRKYINKVGIK